MENKEWRFLRNAIRALMREEGVRQQSLAARLGIGQPHLSKILTGKRAPSPRVEAALRSYLAERRSVALLGGEDWLAEALAAAAKSQDFRDLLHAAIRLMKA